MPDAPDDTMTIREMCDTFDVTPRTLRFYEAKELLFPLREGPHRRFTKRDRARLKLILRGKRFGFTLDQIRELLDLYNADGQHLVQLMRVHELAQERLTDMEHRRAELDDAINDLRSQLKWGAARIAELQNNARPNAR